MSSLDVRTLKVDPHWVKASQVAEYVYHLLPKFPEEEQWDMISKLRQDAFSLTRDMAQAVGSTDPRDKITSYDYVIRALFALYSSLTMAKRLYDVSLDPEIMVSIEELTTAISGMSDTAKSQIQEYMKKYERLDDTKAVLA